VYLRPMPEVAAGGVLVGAALLGVGAAETVSVSVTVEVTAFSTVLVDPGQAVHEMAAMTAVDSASVRRRLIPGMTPSRSAWPPVGETCLSDRARVLVWVDRHRLDLRCGCVP